MSHLGEAGEGRFADVNVKSGKILGKGISDHREIWFALMQCAKRGNPRGVNESSEGLF